MKDFSYITNSSPSFIESLYQEFVKDPNSVDPEFRRFFEGFDFAISNGKPGSNGISSNGTSVAASKDVQAKQGDTQPDWKREVSAYLTAADSH